ncbi:MAG: rod shape-determining protein MreD [Peptostreptococcaceae bacterium]
MKKVIVFLIGILIIIIENSITNYINIFGTSINLILIYTIIISLYFDKFEVSIIGALLGLFKDALITAVFGVNGLILFTVSYLISNLKEKVYKESNLTIFTLVFLTTLLDSLINLIITVIMFNLYGIIINIIKSIVLIPINNAIVGVLLFNAFRPVISKLKND